MAGRKSEKGGEERPEKGTDCYSRPSKRGGEKGTDWSWSRLFLAWARRRTKARKIVLLSTLPSGPGRILPSVRVSHVSVGMLWQATLQSFASVYAHLPGTADSSSLVELENPLCRLLVRSGRVSVSAWLRYYMEFHTLPQIPFG